MNKPTRSLPRPLSVLGRKSPVIAALILASAAAETQALPYYSITDLGTLGGAASGAEDINNAGQVVGYAQTTGSKTSHATLWQRDGTIHDLGAPAGGTGNSWANALNERGQVVGDAEQTIPGRGVTTANIPVLWQNGAAQALGGYGSAQDINETGQVVGYTSFKFMENHATVWQNGTVTDLQKVIGGDSGIQGINDKGQLAGYVTSASWLSPTYWASPSSKPTTGTGGKPGGTFSFGTYQAINNAGQMLGISGKRVAGGSTGGAPVLAANGVVQMLPSLGGSASAALDINDAGWAVGWSLNAAAAQHAALWQNGQVSDLNSLLAPNSTGFTLTSANAINDLGQIVGQLATGHAYVANPAGTATWTGGNGDWETGGNWEQGFKPGKLQDPVIAPASGTVAVNGPLADAEVASLTLGGGAGNADLNLNSGNLAIRGDMQINARSHLGVATGKSIAAVGGYVQHGGNTDVDGSLQAASVDVQGGIVNLNGAGNLQGIVRLGAAAALHANGDNRISGNLDVGGGLLAVAPGKSLAVTGNITQNTGSASVDGVLQAASIVIQGGVLNGTGTLQGAVTLGPAASLNPGHSPGTLNIAGDFILSGTLNIEIAGPSLFDVLNITGNADFSTGIINFSFINGFMPQAGDMFQWLNASGAVVGLGSASIHIVGLPSGLDYSLGVASHALQISAPTPPAIVPAPATGLLLLAGLHTCQRARSRASR